MAPEGLDKDSRVIEKTDLYSFAVMVLFLMFPAELAITLLFLPIDENWEELNQRLAGFSLILRIFKSLLTNPRERVDFDSWKVIIQEMKNFDKNWLISHINCEILEQNGLDLGHLNKALEKEGGLYFYILDYFEYDIRSSQVNENEAYKMSTANSQMQKLSMFQSNVEIQKISQGRFF